MKLINFTAERGRSNKINLARLTKEYGYLLDQKIVTDIDLQKAIFISKKTNTSMAATLISHLQAPKDAVGKSLSNFHDCNFKEYDPNAALATEIFMNCNLVKSLLLDQCWDHHDSIRFHHLDALHPGASARSMHARDLTATYGAGRPKPDVWLPDQPPGRSQG